MRRLAKQTYCEHKARNLCEIGQFAEIVNLARKLALPKLEKEVGENGQNLLRAGQIEEKEYCQVNKISANHDVPPYLMGGLMWAAEISACSQGRDITAYLLIILVYQPKRVCITCCNWRSSAPCLHLHTSCVGSQFQYRCTQCAVGDGKRLLPGVMDELNGKEIRYFRPPTLHRELKRKAGLFGWGSSAQKARAFDGWLE
jgi:hypothetical protein